MKGHRQTYRPLIEIVNDSLTDVGESMHQQFRFLRWGMKYAEQQHFDYNLDVRTVEVNLKPWKAIELPEDCVSWIAFGIKNGSDVMTFVNDRKMAMIYDEVDGEKQPNANPTYSPDLSSVPLSDLQFPFLNYLGGNKGQIFGLRAKDNGLGYFNENRK